MILRTVLTLLLLLPAAGAWAGVADSYELEANPATGVASKVAVDAIAHGTSPIGVWLATGRGVNFSLDQGDSWLIYDQTNGLPGDNISALFSIGDRLWVASSHQELLGGQLFSLSDGLSYTDNNGNAWTTLDFGPSGLNIPYVQGGDRTIFDITGHHDVGFFNSRQPAEDVDWLFFSAFAGGLLASQDGGTNWRRIFPSRNDSIQFYLTNEAPSLRNRYFSCVADTSHGDTLFLWAGTASGIFQYVYAPPRAKLFSRQITTVAFCDTCTDGTSSMLFLGGSNGISYTSTHGGPVGTRFQFDGLPGPYITALFSLGDYLLAGTADTVAGQSTGLAMSTDFGDSYTAVNFPEVTGPDNYISDFAVFGDRLYLAGQAAGLFSSVDSGQTWTSIPLDTLYSSPALQAVYAVNSLEDTLYLGTDSGLVELTLDPSGVIQTAVHEPFLDTDSSGGRVIQVRPQLFENDSTGLLDSSIIWTVNRPAAATGISMVGRRNWNRQIDTTIDDQVNPPDTTIDTSFTAYGWQYLRRGVNTYDVNFLRDTAFTVGELGIWFTSRGEDPTNFFHARQYVNDTVVVASLDADTVTAMEVKGDTVVFSTLNGFAVSLNRGQNFRIQRMNADTLSPDLVINHTYFSSAFGLAGDFIPALGVQYLGDQPARIWAGARPATFGGQGISVGEFDDATGALKWQAVYPSFAWNLEFIDSTAFAATDDGLLMNTGVLDSLDTQWENISFVDGTNGDVLIAPGTSVFGVGLVDTVLWVGTDDGTVKMYPNDLNGAKELFQHVDSTTSNDEVYAFPVPFSPLRGQQVDFHFVVEEAGNVTLEIYDFAMNLVARPIDGVYYTPGIYPGEGRQGITWDGRNGNGDNVAVGIYYFRVDLPSGESRWGKLAVIP